MGFNFESNYQAFVEFLFVCHLKRIAVPLRKGRKSDNVDRLSRTRQTSKASKRRTVSRFANSRTVEAAGSKCF